MSVIPKTIFGFGANPIRILMAFSTEVEKPVFHRLLSEDGKNLKQDTLGHIFLSQTA